MGGGAVTAPPARTSARAASEESLHVIGDPLGRGIIGGGKIGDDVRQRRVPVHPREDRGADGIERNRLFRSQQYLTAAHPVLHHPHAARQAGAIALGQREAHATPSPGCQAPGGMWPGAT